MVAPSSTTQPTITTPACGADARHTAEPGGGVGVRSWIKWSIHELRSTHGTAERFTLLEPRRRASEARGYATAWSHRRSAGCRDKAASEWVLPISDVAHKSGRGGQHKHVSARPVNTLLPPQLRGRSNNTTQDLEGWA